jgi:hypothetical protein
MPIGFFLPTLDWAEHDRRVRACHGRAQATRIALYFEVPGANLKRLDLLCGFCPADSRPETIGLHEAHGTIAGWCGGSSWRASSVARVRAATDGQIDLVQWPGAALFELAAQRKRHTLDRLLQILATRASSVRSCIALEPNGRGGVEVPEPAPWELSALRDRGTLEALVVLLALARLGEVLDDPPLHRMAAACAFDTWPHVVASTPALSHCWRELTDSLHAVFWQRTYRGGVVLNLSLALLHRHVEMCTSDATARFADVSRGVLRERERASRRRRSVPLTGTVDGVAEAIRRIPLQVAR